MKKLLVILQSVFTSLPFLVKNIDTAFVDRNYAYWLKRIDNAKSVSTIDLIHKMIKQDVEVFRQTTDPRYVNDLYYKLTQKLTDKENQLLAEFKTKRSPPICPWGA